MSLANLQFIPQTSGQALTSTGLHSFPEFTASIVDEVKAGDASITVTTVGSVASVTASGNFLTRNLSSDGGAFVTDGSGGLSMTNLTADNGKFAGQFFGLKQTLASVGYTGTGTPVTCNGTSGLVTLTGFVLNAAATTQIVVSNSSMTSTSLVLLTSYPGSVVPGGTAGFVVEVFSKASTQFIALITNKSVTNITSGSYSFAFALV